MHISGPKSILHLSNVHNNSLVLTTVLAVYLGCASHVNGIYWCHRLGNKKSKLPFGKIFYLSRFSKIKLDPDNLYVSYLETAFVFPSAKYRLKRKSAINQYCKSIQGRDRCVCFKIYHNMLHFCFLVVRH